MFRSFVRMLGLAGETNRTRHAGQGHFSPRLEALDGRVMPSTLHVAAGIDTIPAMARASRRPPRRSGLISAAGPRAGSWGRAISAVEWS